MGKLKIKTIMKQNVYIEIIRQLSLTTQIIFKSDWKSFPAIVYIVFNPTKILSLIAFRVSRLENYEVLSSLQGSN